MQPSLQLSRWTSISQSPGTRFESLFQIQIAMRSSVGAASPSIVIEQSMVQGFLGIVDRFRQFIEMKDVTRRGVRLALDDDAGAKRMSVHARVRRPAVLPTAENAPPRTGNPCKFAWPLNTGFRSAPATPPWLETAPNGRGSPLSILRNTEQFVGLHG